jgi:hypothetical protein
MANKKDLGKLDTFSFNDIDLGAFDDFGFDGPEISVDRTPVQRIVGRFKKGMSRTFDNSHYQEQILRRGLPQNYESSFDAYHDVMYSFRTLNEGIKRELKPGMREVRDLGRRLFPGKPPLIPEKLYEKFSNWVDDNGFTGRSDAQMDNDASAIMLNQVFSKQAEIQEAERREDTIREELKTISERKRFEFTHLERVRTNTLLTSIVNYQDRVTTSYSKRMLELQFKSYLTQMRMLEAVKTTGEKTNSQLDAITKNTALPDFVKMRNVEAVKELTRRRIIQSALESSPIAKITGLTKRLLNNFTKNIISGVQMAGSFTESAASATATGDFDDPMQEQRPEPKGFKENMQRAAESGAENVVPWLLSRYVGKGADKVRDYIGRGKEGSLRHRIARGGKLADYWVGGADQHLQNRIREGGDGALDAFLMMSDADKESYRANRSLTQMQYGADRYLGGMNSVGTAMATEEVIPDWLQRIWGEIYMLRTGESSVERELYDQKHRKFVKTSSASEQVIGQFKEGYNKTHIDKLVDRVVVNLIGSKSISAEARRVLASRIKADAIDGITPTPERYRLLKGTSPQIQSEIRKAIEETYEYDPIEDKLKGTEGELLNQRRRIFKSSRSLMGQFSTVKDSSLRMMDEGKLEALRRAGLVKETKLGLAFDYDRYLELMDQGYTPEDLGVKASDIPPRPDSGGGAERNPVNDLLKEKVKAGQAKFNEHTKSDFIRKQTKSSRDKVEEVINNLQSKEYIDATTGRVIENLSDLRGKITTHTGEVVVTAEELKEGLRQKYGPRFTEMFKSLSGTAERSIKRSRSFVAENKHRVDDLYNKGSSFAKASSANLTTIFDKLSKRECYDSISGKVIESLSDIKGDILDQYGKVILTAADAKETLVERYGDKVNDILSNAKSATARFRDKANVLGTNAYSRIKDSVKRKGKDGEEEVTVKATGTDTLLQRLYNMFNFRLPGAPDSHLNRTKTGDLDGDGIRDGSWQDRLRKRKKAEEERKATAGEKEDSPGMMGKLAGGSKGLLASLAGMLGLGGLMGGEGGGGINVFGMPDFGGKPQPGAPGGPAGPPKPKGKMARVGGALKGIGRVGGNLLLNPVGTILQGLGTAGKWGVQGAGKLLGAGGKALPTIAKAGGRAALHLARFAVPFLMSPVGLVIAGVALAGFAAYKGYQAYKKNKDFKDNILTNLRMAQYGIDPKVDKDMIPRLLMLEEMREKDLARPGEPRPYNDPQTREDVQRIFFTWEADPMNELHQVRVADWYNNRGGPVMSTWVNALYVLKGTTKLDDIDSLNPREKEELLKMVRIPSTDPQSAVNFPMIPMQGSEATAMTGEGVDDIYEKAEEVISKEVSGHDKKVEREKAMANHKPMRVNMNHVAIKQREDRVKKVTSKLVRDMAGKGVLPADPFQQQTKGDDLLKFMTNDNDIMKMQLKDTWRWPMDTGRISSEFGDRIHPKTGERKTHNGIDIAAAEGTPVYAAAEGTIKVMDYLKGYGNAIYILHNDGKETRYAHLSSFASSLSVGSKVLAGQLIGYVGNTGVSTGPHLHFEIRENDSRTAKAIDPYSLISDPNLRNQKRIVTDEKMVAGKSPEGYSAEEGGDLEGVNTIASTAAPKANTPLQKDIPVLLSRDYIKETPGMSTTSKNASTGSGFDVDKATIAYNADMLDASKAQISNLSKVGDGISGMTAEQRAANETLTRIATALENQTKSNDVQFRRANSGITNNTMNNPGAESNDVLNGMYQLALKNNLNPANYMSNEQLSKVTPTYRSDTPTNVTRTSAVMPY